MRVLIACEFSGRVRNAFGLLGHDVTSCDLLESETPCVPGTRHIVGDVRRLIAYQRPYDLVIAHPPCTLLCSLGSQHWIGNQKKQMDAIEFFMFFIRLENVPSICVENPIGIMSDVYRRYDQVIQPYHHGDAVSKKTCLWLKGLEALRPTCRVEPLKPLVGASRRVTVGTLFAYLITLS